MGSSQTYREKSCDRKSSALSKPFFDQNLQLHIPQNSLSKDLSEGHHQIYSHYSVDASAEGLISSDINEKEISLRMEEAQLAHKAWKRMQQHLQAQVENFFSK